MEDEAALDVDIRTDLSKSVKVGLAVHKAVDQRISQNLSRKSFYHLVR